MDADLTPRLGAVNEFPTVTPVADAEARPRAPRKRDAGTWLARVLTADGPADYRWAFYPFAGVLVVFFALVAWQGPCLQIYYGHDNIGFLASAWKVYNGVLPHADYHSALGALNPWIFAAGMWLLGPTASVLSFCTASVAAALGLLAWTVAARRLPAALAAIFAATQFVLALSPHLLRFEWYGVTYDGYYNRQGYALLDTLLLLLFLPRYRETNARAQRRDGLLAGAIVGTLLFLKISYFTVAVGLCGLSFVVFRRSGKRVPWEPALGFGVVFLLCLPLIRFDLPAMLADLRMAAAVRPAAEDFAALSPSVYLERFGESWIETILLALVQSFLHPWWWRPRGTGAGASAPAPSWAEFACTVGASALLCMGNSPDGRHSETPMLTSWVFVLLGCVVRDPALAGAGGRLRAALRRRSVVPTCCLAALLWAYTFGNGLVALCWATSPVHTAWQREALRAHAPVFRSESLEDLRILGSGGGLNSAIYADKVNDGLQLLRTLGGTHRVETLDFVNPFPFALQWPVTRGGNWCWHLGFSFSPAIHPSAEEVFGDVEIVMVPKQPGNERSYEPMKEIYGPYLEEHYSLVVQSAQWYLLRRR